MSIFVLKVDQRVCAGGGVVVCSRRQTAPAVLAAGVAIVTVKWTE